MFSTKGIGQAPHTRYTLIHIQHVVHFGHQALWNKTVFDVAKLQLASHISIHRPAKGSRSMNRDVGGKLKI